jgi:hypothetical protein
LKELLAIQVDMQFADVHTMLQLPSGELEAGCNLALANVLFVLISGASVMFLEADLAYFKKFGKAGKRFVRVLREHYPWQHDDALSAKDAAKLLYTYARNPMTHSFGIGKAAHLFPGAPHDGQQAIWLSKRSLSGTETDEVLRGETAAPSWLPPTIRSDIGGIELSVPTLAWGTAGMLRHLFADPEQVGLAETLAGQLLNANQEH